MFDLTFLGTSASVQSAARNHPGLLVEAGGRRIMVDCGEGSRRGFGSVCAAICGLNRKPPDAAEELSYLVLGFR